MYDRSDGARRAVRFARPAGAGSPSRNTRAIPYVGLQGSIFATLVAILLVPGCATSRRMVASLTANCREVQPGVANEIMRDNPNSLLLDVRHAEEYSSELAHLHHGREIPLSELPRRFHEIGAWKTETVVIFSRDGTDAASACEFLSRQGFLYVTHVEGGVEEWRRRRFGRFDEEVKP